MFPTTKNKFIIKKLKTRRLQRLLQNKEWRLNNLYIVVDSNGNKNPYKSKIVAQDWVKVPITKGRMMMERQNMIDDLRRGLFVMNPQHSE